MKDFFSPQSAAGGTLEFAEPYFQNPNYAAQIKYDGARYVIHKGLDGIVRIYSKHISKTNGMPVMKTAQLAHLAQAVDVALPPGTVLDGEVVADFEHSKSNLVTKVTGSAPARALELQQAHGFVKFIAFDLLAYDGKVITDLPLLRRVEPLYTKVMPELQAPTPYFASSMLYGTSPTDNRNLYGKVVANGGEGIMLKDITAPYQEGSRHDSWVKVKKTSTFDVVFMGIELAKSQTRKKGATEDTDSRIKGKAGAIRFGQYAETSAPDGSLLLNDAYALMELGTVSGFDDATRDDITENAEKYAREERVFEITGQEQFESGAVRHPRFSRWRDDKNASECVFRPDEG